MPGRLTVAIWLSILLWGSLAVAFAIRWLLKLAFRAEQMPRAEAFVDQWWAWAPVVTVVAVIWFYAGLTIGVVAALSSLAFAVYWAHLYPSLPQRRHPDA